MTLAQLLKKIFGEKKHTELTDEDLSKDVGLDPDEDEDDDLEVDEDLDALKHNKGVIGKLARQNQGYAKKLRKVEGTLDEAVALIRKLSGDSEAAKKVMADREATEHEKKIKAAIKAGVDEGRIPADAKAQKEWEEDFTANYDLASRALSRLPKVSGTNPQYGSEESDNNKKPSYPGVNSSPLSDYITKSLDAISN